MEVGNLFKDKTCPVLNTYYRPDTLLVMLYVHQIPKAYEMGGIIILPIIILFLCSEHRRSSWSTRTEVPTLPLSNWVP